MNIIAIDTATETLGISIRREDGKSISLSMNVGYKHGELLVPWIDSLLKQASITPRELNLVVCASGPGSFTGLRIGIATAKGLSFGAACPLVLVSTLDALAFSKSNSCGTVLPVIDAKKKRYYTAKYRNAKRISDYLDIAPEDFSPAFSDEKDILLCGPGAKAVYDAVRDIVQSRPITLDPLYDSYDCNALLALGVIRHAENPSGSADTEGPLYLRKSEAEIGINRKEK